METKVQVDNFCAWYGRNQAVKNITLPIYPNQVTAIIGPSGCGKSTLIRCINRLHEGVPGNSTSGRVLLDGQDIYRQDVDVVEVRRQIGMVFQKANPFPTMSISNNVCAGVRVNGLKPGARLDQVVEDSLRKAALWDEVSNRLHLSGISLSGGQQQRLCIARALAVEPQVLLMDEPCAALDPASTLRIEDLIRELKTNYTIVIVTHNMQQAARVADYTAFVLNGELIEYGPTSELFTRPSDKRTEDYITGRFG